MIIKKALILSLATISILINNSTYAQVIARFAIAEPRYDIEVPVSINLDQLTPLPDSLLILEEVTGSTRVLVPCQIENAYQRSLWWILKPKNTPGKRIFELSRSSKSQPDFKNAAVSDTGGSLRISVNNKNVLQYNYQTHYPPTGIDTVFKRSGFIHPVWSPAGNILTRINPPDHYHHYGIWNPWTDIVYEENSVDLWNLNKKQGTVRFSNLIATSQGNVYAGFNALQEHVVFTDSVNEKVILNEIMDIRVYNIADQKWLWDFTSTLNVTGSPVLLKTYRYGGFGFRATEDWNNNNSSILTSSGKTRKDADGSTAHWCTIDGDVNSGHSGILFMNYPSNYNSPQPIRVWPEDTNGRGDVFFSFSPIKNTDWILQPGKSYVLKYRMLVYEGSITPAQAQNTWNSFAKPIPITITKINSIQ